MAWEEFERKGTTGITGDKPLDEIAIALQRIVTAYEERFARKPTITEILHALETVIGANPTYYVSDPEGLQSAEIIIKRNFAQEEDHIDTRKYQAVYTDAIFPGYYLILFENREVIKITKLQVVNRLLVCEYEILAENITDTKAQSLILTTLLFEYCDQYYKNEADQIKLTNLKTHTQQIITYP